MFFVGTVVQISKVVPMDSILHGCKLRKVLRFFLHLLHIKTLTKIEVFYVPKDSKFSCPARERKG